jgi:hypothetical protein
MEFFQFFIFSKKVNNSYLHTESARKKNPTKIAIFLRAQKQLVNTFVNLEKSHTHLACPVCKKFTIFLRRMEVLFFVSSKWQNINKEVRKLYLKMLIGFC